MQLSSHQFREESTRSSKQLGHYNVSSCAPPIKRKLTVAEVLVIQHQHQMRVSVPSTKPRKNKFCCKVGTFGDSYNSHQFGGRYVFSSNNCSETIQEMLHSLLKILYLLLHKLCKQTKAKDLGTKKYCLLENLDSFDFWLLKTSDAMFMFVLPERGTRKSIL